MLPQHFLFSQTSEFIDGISHKISFETKSNYYICEPFASHGKDEQVFGSICFQMWDGKRAMVSQIIFGFVPKRQASYLTCDQYQSISGRITYCTEDCGAR